MLYYICAAGMLVMTSNAVETLDRKTPCLRALAPPVTGEHPNTCSITGERLAP